jgi:hypothetical protein
MNMKLITQTSCHKELGLLFEQRFIEELKKYFPKARTTANTPFKFISDIKIDHAPFEYDLIEVKSHKYFPNQTTLDVFEAIMNSGIERTKQSGIKQGLFHQFNESIKANKGGWTAVIVGCYLQESRVIFDLWNSDPEEAWEKYSFYKMLLWNGRKVVWCHIAAEQFWEEFKEVVSWDCDYGIQYPLMTLSTSASMDFPNFSHMDDETTLLELYQNLELDLSSEEIEESVRDVLKSIPKTKPTAPSVEPREESIETGELPELIEGISLSKLDLEIIKVSLEAGKDLYDTSLLINKSKSYLHCIYSGAGSYNGPKFQEIRAWMSKLMEKQPSTNQDDLISARQNALILELQEERKSLNETVMSQRNEIQKLKAENLNFAFQLGSKVQRDGLGAPKSTSSAELEATHKKQVASLEEDLADALKMVNRFERIIDNLMDQIEGKRQ